MKRVYIAGLYSKNAGGSEANVLQVLDNIRAGQKAALDVWRLGFAVFCPHLDYQYSLLDDEPITYKMYYENSMAWLEVSDAVLVISGRGIGGGVDKEIARADELGIPVYDSLADLIKYEMETEQMEKWLKNKNYEEKE